MPDRLRIAALISGGGRTLMNLADRIDDGSLPCGIVTVISSRAAAAGVDRARRRGFEVHVVARRDFDDDDAMHDAITRRLQEATADLVCLCGYTRWLRVDDPLVGRVINIHPALLPSFGGRGMYGRRVHEAVLAAGVEESGCTVHVVDDRYDHGPIILQRRCPVRADDTPGTLAARVFAEECIAYPEVIAGYASGRIRQAGGRVEIDEAIPPACGPGDLRLR